MNIATSLLATGLIAGALSTIAHDVRAQSADATPGSAAVPAARAATAALPEPDFRRLDRWYLQTSLYTRHFRPNPDHVNHNRLINIERQRADDWVAGGAFFKNSFGQESQYLYVGKLWRPFETMPDVHLKLTGGLLHGYKGQFKDKIPFNQLGVAPALLPSIGYTTRRFGTELILFGAAGLMWTAGIYFD